MKGYKVFSPEFTSNHQGFQYKENETFEVDLPINICSHGLHFCIKASDCFSYYTFDPKNIVCEVEAIGETISHNEDSKICTNKLRVGRRLTWAEVLVVANEGNNNTGLANSGNRNSGDSNSGYRNSGAFCTEKNPTLILFDKPTKISVKDWERSEIVMTMNSLLDFTMWVPSSAMTGC